MQDMTYKHILYDKEIIHQTALLLNVCNQTILNMFLSQVVFFIIFL